MLDVRRQTEHKQAVYVFFVVYFSLFVTPLFAENIRLVVFTPQDKLTRLVLPVEEGENPEHVLQRYLDVVTKEPGLQNLTKSPWFGTEGTFQAFQPDKSRPSFALIDNNFTENSVAMGAFHEGGANVYLIPLGAELVLESEEQREKFRKEIAKTFSSLVALGGADVNPALYGEEKTFARDFNPKRDEMEISLIKKYMKEGRGVLYGICRGHQLIGVANGFSLIQDLEKQMGAVGHRSSDHALSFVPGVESLLENFLGTNRVEVNSFHHQAIRPKCSQSMRVVALGGQPPVIEAMQSSSGKVFTMQFHPEAMNNTAGKRIMKGMVEHAKNLAN